MFEKSQSEIQGLFASGDKNYIFRTILKRLGDSVDKNFSINMARRQHNQYLSETSKTVLFSPEQIEIMTGPPDRRRKYFNSLLGLFDPVYKKYLVNYDKALRKRNKILERYKDNEDLFNELAYWNDYLEKQAGYLTKKRQEYVDFLNEHNNIDNKAFSVKYLKNEFNERRLEENFELEKRYRRTVIGPQKDDFEIYQKNNSLKNLHHFGSRSEQRLAIFWLKFNEIRLYEVSFKNKPLLLLDDIFSELDIKNKKLIIDLVKKYQTIVTTTEIELLELADMPKSIIRL